MARTVETVLGVKEDSELGVNEILETIQQHLGSKRIIAIDRNEFFLSATNEKMSHSMTITPG